MKMKKRLSLLMAATLVATAAMTGCGGGRQAAPETTTAAAAQETKAEETKAEETKAAEAAQGFEAGATIGVSLPWLGTQNWKEADEMFKTQLEAAGFKAIVQAADNKVPQQQQQIESIFQ